ncbi:hypothetical protein [Bradyrhizobium cenepequi]
MSRIIEAKAVISAADKTGNVLDKVAAKFKGLEKTAKSIGSITPLSNVGTLFPGLRELGVAERDLMKVRREYAAFQNQVRSTGAGFATQMRLVGDWEKKQLTHWRNLKVASEDAQVAQAKYLRSHGGGLANAARWGLGAFGAIGGAYMVGRAARAGIKASAESQRETARDYLAGMSDADSQRIKDEALRVSGRYQSVDATTMHERLRDTAMITRSVDKAMELSETIAQGTTVLQSLKGKDQAIEEGRKFFSALDVLGKNIDPKEVKELFNGYIKALGVEGADMDLGGALTFARQSRAAGGVLSNRFLMTTAPGLMRDLGDPQLGTALATALSQNIGGRATKASKAAQQEYGLRDKSGNFVDSRRAMSDPDKWAWETLIPALQKKGVDVNDNVKVSEVLSKLFSNRVVGDVFSKLITQREQYQAKAGQYEKAPGLAGAAALPAKDPFVAYEGVLAQLRNLATQAPVMDSAASGLNSLSGAIANLNGSIAKGEYAGFFKAFDDFISKGAKIFETDVKDAKAIGGIIGKVLDFDRATGTNWHPQGPGASRLGTRPPSQKALEQWSASSAPIPWLPESDVAKSYKPAEANWSMWSPGSSRTGGAKNFTPPKFPAPQVSDTTTYGTGVGGDKGTVQAQLTGSAEVKGTVDGTFTVKAGSDLISIYEQMKKSINMVGQLVANGVGSTGKSSPDAAAPSVPHVGSAGNSPM